MILCELQNHSLLSVDQEYFNLSNKLQTLYKNKLQQEEFVAKCLLLSTLFFVVSICICV